ncbi:MAG: glycoside hydrolase family 2 protein [Clostridia bacterium]|nr:glycoside hydrolase family 2 protein [Clostridia bacterium]
MKRTLLNGTWNLKGNGYDVNGKIPGSLYSFLLDAGLVPDPFYRDNELLFLELAEHQYSFEKQFEYKKSNSSVLLVCEGLDTLCRVYVNGALVGESINMHVCYEFDVTSALKDGLNTIRIDIDPVNPYIKERYAKEKVPACDDALAGYMYVRKAHCMLGWDWGPRLPDMGIWRDIYLLEKDSARLVEFNVDQRHENGKVFITPWVRADGDCDIRITVTAPDQTSFEIKANEQTEIDSPKLWWPNNLGEQNLYTVLVELLEDGRVVDSKAKKIGLRTLKLIRERDKWGESFCHEVNGVRFFAMGADYIPEDNVFSRITPERTYKLLKQCKDSNFNTVRVWGGGYYPDEFFFDACDELGIVIFFDLMFACCMYNPDEKMWESMKTEVRQNVTRIRDRASLALISGNNEIEEMVYYNIYMAPYRDAYIKIFEEDLREIVNEVAPHIEYVASSPSTCGHCVDPRNENFGDQHYWDVWHGSEAVQDYRKRFCRYLSEFGFQGMCDYKTVLQFTEEEDRNLSTRVMELHQRNRNGYAKIMSHIQQYFLYPTSFKALIYTSQLMQAEAIKTAIEHFRRNRGRCMGTLYWQLNDIWPVTSWASIDYYGRWKALQYVAKRCYRPINISCEETGYLQTARFATAEPNHEDYVTKARLCVHNETLKAAKGVVRWSLCDNMSNVLQSGEQEVEVKPMSVCLLDELDFNKTDYFKNHISFELVVDGRVVASGTELFAQHKYYNYQSPKLKVSVEGDEVVVKGDAYAKYVEIYSETEDFLLEDNFFDMEKGERRVKIVEGNPRDLHVRSVYDIR